MTVEAFRLHNFMGFADTGWIELRPITLLFGRNSTGKSALMRALLLLHQSLKYPSPDGPFAFVIDGRFDYGDYETLIRDHDPAHNMTFWFECSFPQPAPLPPATQDDEEKIFFEPIPLRVDTAVGHTLASEFNIIGAAKPGEDLYRVNLRVRMSYRQRKDDKQIELSELDLYDKEGDIILRATRSKAAESESQWHFESDFLDIYANDETGVWPYMEVFTRDGFLPNIGTRHGTLDDTDWQSPSEDDLGKTFQSYWRILWGVRHEISQFLRNLTYLGPLRAEPQRFYYTAGQEGQLDITGAQAARDFSRVAHTNDVRVGRIQKWMRESDLGVVPESYQIDTLGRLHELTLTGTSNGKTHRDNIREVGFGVSQVFPIVVRTQLTPEGGILLIEQPELHLHPGAQSQLADLFVETINDRNRRIGFLIETHSEHLFLRLRRYVAESSINKLLPKDQHHLLESDVRVFFVDRQDGLSTVNEIKISPLGEVSVPAGFKGFFADDAMEVAKLASARLQGKQRM